MHFLHFKHVALILRKTNLNKACDESQSFQPSGIPASTIIGLKVSGVIQFSTSFTDLQQSNIPCTLFIYFWKIPEIKLHRLKSSPKHHFTTSGHVGHSEPAQVVKSVDLALPIF